MRNKILIAMFGVALAGAVSFGCGSSSTTNSNTGGSGGGAGVGGIAGSTGGAGGSTGGAGGSTGGAGGTAADCFMGTPSTHEELINACTTAEKIDKTVKLPNNLKVGDMLPALQ
jgi:hypothetical protein